MTVLRNKWLFVVASFTLTMSPAWSKSLCLGYLTDSGYYLRLNPQYIKELLSYSPLLILLDLVFSLVIVYYLKKESSKNSGQRAMS